jgi:hypothetical protein
MRTDVRRFRSCLESAASSLPDIRFSEFSRSLGVGDFCLDAEQSGWDPKRIGAEAIVQLTEGNGSTNDFAVCLGVTQFLDETHGFPRVDQRNPQRIKDVAQLTISPRTVASVLQWIDSWYS